MRTELPPIPKFHPHLVSALRADLVAAAWVPQDLGISVYAADRLREGDPDPAKSELEETLAQATEDSPRVARAILTKLFLTGQPVAADVFLKALPTVGVRGGGLLGVTRCSGIGEQGKNGGESAQGAAPANVTVFPRVSIEPVDLMGEGGVTSAFLVADLGPTQTADAPHPDQVLGMTGAARTMLYLLPAGRVGRALDLGCGSGILAMQMALWAQQVVATDISERACGFTRFNAALNGLSVDVRVGSLFEPVAGEHFDLIASNPPFALVPEQTETDRLFTYRQSSVSGRQLMADVVAGCVDHLDEGGLAILMGNWPIVAGHDGTQGGIAAEWVKASGGQGTALRAYIAQRDTLTADRYARWWTSDELGPYPTANDWAKSYGWWAENLASQQVNYVALGFIALQKVGGPASGPGVAGEHAPTLVVDDISAAEPLDGTALLRALDNLVAPEGWMGHSYNQVEGIHEERVFAPGDATPKALTLVGAGAGSSRLVVPAAVSAFVGVCDGQVTAAQVIPAIAHLLDEDEADVADQIGTYIPSLVRAGVLTA